MEKQDTSAQTTERAENPLHKPERKLTSYQKRFVKDYAALRSQAFKQATVNPEHSLVYFDRPGDTVEGYLVAVMPASAVSASHFILDYNGTKFEIKAHQLLRQIIDENDLLGEYIRIIYRGRVPSKFFAKNRKSYYVFKGKGKASRLVQAEYPKMEETPEMKRLFFGQN